MGRYFVGYFRSWKQNRTARKINLTPLHTHLTKIENAINSKEITPATDLTGVSAEIADTKNSILKNIGFTEEFLTEKIQEEVQKIMDKDFVKNLDKIIKIMSKATISVPLGNIIKRTGTD